MWSIPIFYFFLNKVILFVKSTFLNNITNCLKSLKPTIYILLLKWNLFSFLFLIFPFYFLEFLFFEMISCRSLILIDKIWKKSSLIERFFIFWLN